MRKPDAALGVCVYVGYGQEKLGPIIFLLWATKGGSLVQMACLGRRRLSLSVMYLHGHTVVCVHGKQKQIVEKIRGRDTMRKREI